jgi:hypothetical protein
MTPNLQNSFVPISNSPVTGRSDWWIGIFCENNFRRIEGNLRENPFISSLFH